MIPKIKEFKPEEVLEAAAYYKVVASKIFDICEQHPELWFEVNLSIGTLNKKHTVTINTGKNNGAGESLENH